MWGVRSRAFINSSSLGPAVDPGVVGVGVGVGVGVAASVAAGVGVEVVFNIEVACSPLWA
eukprot:SAG31_NODE_1815_length_7210_cov_7.167628_7_plen_60_part_00